MASKESPENNPGLDTSPDEATNSYFLHHTNYRIKDPKVSLDFYSRIMGMSLLKRVDFPAPKISLYLLGYKDASSAPSDPFERTVWTIGQKGVLELTHNWGTETDPDFKGYHNGNTEPLGYGHIGIAVDDMLKASQRFESLGVEFVNRPNETNPIVFIQDPDGYWIEVFDAATVARVAATADA
ncbi:hypothetical protein Pfo_007279 [Paulownia fortunei]|nr:hypothetical protein Pfo_007279 [Paulownia fortunei]